MALCDDALTKKLDQILAELARLRGEVALLSEQADEIVEKLNDLSVQDGSGWEQSS